MPCVVGGASQVEDLSADSKKVSSSPRPADSGTPGKKPVITIDD